ncbi:PaaI family thioesterase [Mycobacterium sp. 852002-40037_SCH5390672]|uniref:PaaI family thioesterase n=2 Tax=Mycobacterium TaxID=1763 RepID=UPI00080554B2|nr:PaaI family thioesterase [Mycobacterium sp. 852002-40037_SCH5390672]OBB91904.1 thioesterase [Mycobacterium sp. 852002-40037_SCH5390672]
MSNASGHDDAPPPIFRLTEPGPGFSHFVAGMRTLQDLAVSAAPEDGVFVHAAQRVDELIDLLGHHEAAEGASLAGRVPNLPGAGSLLMPPWTITRFEPDGVDIAVEYSRFYVGARSVVHGGTLPMIFDLIYGMVIHAAGRAFSRTAKMEVDYHQPVPIDTPLTVHGHILDIDGRKTTTHAELRGPDAGVLVTSQGLLISPRTTGKRQG